MWDRSGPTPTKKYVYNVQRETWDLSGTIAHTGNTYIMFGEKRGIFREHRAHTGNTYIMLREKRGIFRELRAHRNGNTYIMCREKRGIFEEHHAHREYVYNVQGETWDLSRASHTQEIHT